MRTAQPFTYKPAGQTFEFEIPAGVRVVEATNLPQGGYWVQRWPGMSEEAESWHRNYGFHLGYFEAGICPYRTGTFEKAVYDFLVAAEFDLMDDSFDVVGFELWREVDGGWSVNTPFRISSSMPAWAVIEDARARWENFKLNYIPKARVSGLSDTGEENEICLECDGVAFLTITRRGKDSE